MAPFHHGADPAGLVRRALARQIRIEHGWRTKRRTLALVGAAGSGKTLTAARLCHAYATGSPLAVRTLSLEPAAAAHRLGALTQHLDIGVRAAETPQAAASAAARMPGESLIVIDTPAVSPGDPEGIAALAAMLAAVDPDETHLLVPASTDARAVSRLHEALAPSIPINRLLITRLDEVESAAAAVGQSFTMKRPVSYVTSGRRPTAGLRPADAAELAAMVLP
jgi:flagellar biosynthesis GTPase FlhF